jgi:hypothetical protein
MMPEQTKICSKCEKKLFLSSFYTDKKGGKYGVRSLCKICLNQINKDYRKSKDGVITQIYHQQRQNSVIRNHPIPSYSKQELYDWLISNPQFHILFDNWIKSGYKKEFAPSCDRVSSLRPYSFDNLQLDTFAQNLKNENYEMMQGIIGRAIPVIGTSIKTGASLSFISASQAQRKLGFHKSHISACCLGKRKSTGRYTWRYTT